MSLYDYNVASFNPILTTKVTFVICFSMFLISSCVIFVIGLLLIAVEDGLPF